MKLAWLKEFYRKPRFRHGVPAVLLTCAFVAVCVLLNAGLTVLEDENGWWKDMSFNQYATTTEETEEILSRMEADVELYLLYQSGEEDVELYQVLRHYGAICDRITVKLTDIAQNPGVLTRFQGDSETTPEADTVIVNCPETGRYKLIDYSDFLTAGYNTETGEFELEGIAYEKKLTEAIVEVTRENVPVIGILTGHGELDSDTLSLFTSFLEDNGNQVCSVNLLSGDSLEGVAMLVIASPVLDFTDGETETLAAYAKEGGNFFVMRDYTAISSEMPNYTSFLKSYGVVPIDGIVVAGAEDTGSYYENQIHLLPYMESMDMTLSLISSGMDVLLMPSACAFQVPGESTASLTTGTVLKTGPHAYVRSLTDGVDSLEKQPADPEGEFPVALFAHKMHANGNVSRLFISGSSDLFTKEYIYQRTYCQEFLAVLLQELVPSSQVSLDIMASAAVRPGLKVGSQGLALIPVIALPLLVAGAGIWVLWRRRRG